MEKRKRTLGEDDKDLLALLINANGSTREDQKMSDEEVRAQMATLVSAMTLHDGLANDQLFAGSTTTGATISSALHNLSQHPEFQRRLRAEVESVGEDKPSL